ncbi:hypothetical protein Vi05172_g1105 [Venturia inaequalis]|nr:hypothetical protein Vi05172_g1105 [Venturia inaequalis]
MKLSTFLPVILALATPILSCHHFKRCWCQLDDQTYQGKEHQNIASDEHTVKACREPGTIGYDGVNNFKTCFRFKKRWPPFLGSYSIKNCNWNNQCRDAGASAGLCTQRL